MQRVELRLATYHDLRRSWQMAPGHGEEAAPIIHLHAPLAIPAGGQLRTENDVQSLSRWGDLRLGVEFPNDFHSPFLDLTALGVQHFVQVHAAKRILRSEDETYAIVAPLARSVVPR
jgi:hypothetical protein